MQHVGSLVAARTVSFPDQGSNLGPPVLGAQGLSHWTTRAALLWFLMALDSGSTGFKLSSPLQAHPAVTVPSSSGLHSHPPFLPVSPGSAVCDFSLLVFTGGATLLPPDSVISSVSPLGCLEHWPHPAPSAASDTGVRELPCRLL